MSMNSIIKGVFAFFFNFFYSGVNPTVEWLNAGARRAVPQHLNYTTVLSTVINGVKEKKFIMMEVNF